MTSSVDAGPLSRLIDRFARQQPEHAALAAPGRAPLTYKSLSRIVADIEALLREAGEP